MRRKKPFSPSEFQEFMASQTPLYDKMILEDIRPEDGWVCNVEAGYFDPYTSVLNQVRRLVEGDAYDGDAEFRADYLDRFEKVWPNLTGKWEPVPPGTTLGEPCG